MLFRSFAHNGNLKSFNPPAGKFYQTVGNTDSERAFCHILESLRNRFDTKPATDVLFDAVRELAEEIRASGMFNFILSNGEMMFAHASTLLFYIVRKAPFG